MKSTIKNYNDFRNKLPTLFLEKNHTPNPTNLLNFLVRLHIELVGNNSVNYSLDQLFQIIKNSLENVSELDSVKISLTTPLDLFSVRKVFRDIFQKKNYTHIDWVNLLEKLLFIQISELITEIENWGNFNKWENLSIYKYVEAGISGLIDSQSSQAEIVTPILLCAFIEFWKNYE